jgi:hypothetical protein
LELKKISAVERAKKGQKIDEDDAAAFENQKRLFNEFYNRRLKKKKLRNTKRSDIEQDTEARIIDAVNDVSNYLEKNYSGVGPSSSTTRTALVLEPADLIQKMIYEPPISRNGKDHDESFTVIYQDESKLHGVTTEYLEWALGPGVVYCALKTGRRIHEVKGKQVAFTVPVGDSNADVAPISCLVNNNNTDGRPLKKIKYYQGDSNYCFMYSFASALHYMGKIDESRMVASMAHEVSSKSLVDQLKSLVNLVTQRMANVSPKAKGDNLKGATIEQLLEAAKKEELMIVVPKGNGKSTSHAVTICMCLVFDSTQEYPLTVTPETFNFVAGSTGFEKTYMTRSFRVVTTV